MSVVRTRRKVTNSIQDVKRTKDLVAGVNRCSVHGRLAKFRGLMIGGKYGAVIGRETHFFVCAQ
jgi:hypothetical protein